jgi:hypothetical protein
MYFNSLAIALANELLPHDEYPSIAIISFLSISFFYPPNPLKPGFISQSSEGELKKVDLEPPLGGRG